MTQHPDVIIVIIEVVFATGCVGGLIGGLFDAPWEKIAKESKPEEKRMKILPYKSPDCEKLFPGLLMNILLGGVAAIVFWGLYGPFAGAAIVGASPPSGVSPFLTVGQLVDSLLIGMGGTGVLLTLSNLRCAVVKAEKHQGKPSSSGQ